MSLQFTRPVEPESWPSGYDHFSASSASTFMRCPEQWRQVYVLRKRKRPSAAALWGTADHRTIESDYRSKLDRGEHLLPEQLAQTFSDIWEERLDRDGGLRELDFGKEAKTVPAKSKLAGQMKDAGIKLTALYQTEIGMKLTPLEMETAFRIELPDVPVPVVGYIDLIATDTQQSVFSLPPRIIERKTVSRTESKPKSDWLAQARVYQLAHNKALEFQPAVRKITKPTLLPAMALESASDAEQAATARLLSMLVAQVADLWARYGPEDPWPGAITHPWACNYCAWGPQDAKSCYWWAA